MKLPICCKPWLSVFICANGDMYNCYWQSEPFANMKDSSFEEEWNCEKIQRMRSELSQGKHPKECRCLQQVGHIPPDRDKDLINEPQQLVRIDQT